MSQSFWVFSISTLLLVQSGRHIGEGNKRSKSCNPEVIEVLIVFSITEVTPEVVFEAESFGFVCRECSVASGATLPRGVSELKGWPMI